jgi:hypothetical protein
MAHRVLQELKRWISHWVRLSEMLFILLATLPCVVIAVTSGDHQWLSIGLVSSSLYLVQSRLGWGLLSVFGHGVLIAAGFSLLFLSQGEPWLFSFLCALLGAGSIGVTCFGRNLRTLGTWIFIPSLYLACELYDGVNPEMTSTNYWAILPELGFAFLGPLLIVFIRQTSSRSGKPVKSTLGRIPPEVAGEPERNIGWSLGGIFVAIFVLSLAVQSLDIEHGQWIIWSAVSVSTGQLASMHRKLGDRGRGALAGLLLGLGIAFLFPSHGAGDELAALLLPLTLVVRNYPVAFAGRCLLIVIAAGSVAQGELAAEIRLGGVLAGGIIGVLCAHLAFFFDGLIRGKDQRYF